jgi:hypothetical protein
VSADTVAGKNRARILLTFTISSLTPIRLRPRLISPRIIDITVVSGHVLMRTTHHLAHLGRLSTVCHDNPPPARTHHAHTRTPAVGLLTGIQPDQWRYHVVTPRFGGSRSCEGSPVARLHDGHEATM